MDDMCEALLRWVLADGATAPRRALLENWNDPIAALAAGPKAWREAGLSDAQAPALHRPDAARLARCSAWLKTPGARLLGWHDPDYPPLLRRIASPPLALFVVGDVALLWHPLVAVVGSRAATAGGLANARDFCAALVTFGYGIASGLAAGIDTAAHAAALDRGAPTVAVLGTGPDVPYPRANADLHARIADAGALVSEHPPGTTPRREHFPSRNRILAGLSLGTLVVEAALRSGALITAREAAEAGRDVFALPGSIHNPMARGCHRLLRDGATLVEDAAEIHAILAPQVDTLAEALRTRLAAPTSSGTAAAPFIAASPSASPDYQCLWHALGHDPTGMDELTLRTALTPAELSSMLLVMELEGRVAHAHGRYSRKR